MCAIIQILIKDEKAPLPYSVIPNKFGDDLFVFIKENTLENTIFKAHTTGTLLYFTPDPTGTGCSCEVLGDVRQYAGDDFRLCEIDKKYHNNFKEFTFYMVEDLGFNVLFGIKWDGIEKYIKVNFEEFCQLIDSGKVKEDRGYEIVSENPY